MFPDLTKASFYPVLWRQHKYWMAFILILALVVLPAGVVTVVTAQTGGNVPTMTITGVVRNTSVTFRTNNYPPNQTFHVYMGPMGSRGVGGIWVASFNSGGGGSLVQTVPIPAQMQGANRIAIRAQTRHRRPYYSFNWFYNTTTGTGGTGGIPGTIPTFSILDVEKDVDVTIRTNNFPAGETFIVTMGKMGTRGINGIPVATTVAPSAVFTQTYKIPDDLKGDYQIAIRLQSDSGYYAFNWFYNNTTDGDPGTGGQPAPTAGTPTITITGVQQDNAVTFSTNNYPANQRFYVYLGEIGTRGIGGLPVSHFDSGAGGTVEQTVNIPAELHGKAQIAIRVSSNHARPYYSYNWFDNVNTP